MIMATMAMITITVLLSFPAMTGTLISNCRARTAIRPHQERTASGLYQAQRI